MKFDMQIKRIDRFTNLITIHLSLFFFTLLITASLTAQDMNLVKANIDSLTSPYFFGRGYTKEGDKKAAQWIKKKFERYGLSPIKGSYLQPFPLRVVVYPEEVTLKINGKDLQLGRDFIPVSYARPGKGKLKPLPIDSTVWETESSRHAFLNENLEEKALIFEESFFAELMKADPAIIKKAQNAGSWISLHEATPIMTMAQQYYTPPYFMVVEDSITREIKDVAFTLSSTIEENYESQNVWGMVKGSESPDSILLITAHYDHLGGIGDSIYFPGANDNASGIAMLFELAKYFSDPENKPSFSMVFIAFSGEEAGLQGSKYASENFPFDLAQISFLLNIDLMSTGDIGIVAVNGTCCPKEYNLLDQINVRGNYLGRVRKRGQAPNSDHFYFNEKGVDGFFVYTEGDKKTYYHSIYDKTFTLPLDEFQDIYEIFKIFLLSLQ